MPVTISYRLYQQILGSDGSIHLKTDSPDLYLFTKLVIDFYELELIQDIDDVYSGEEIDDELQIKTYYESLDIAKSNKIHYLRFRLPIKTLPDNDNQLKELIVEQETERRGA